MNESTIQKQITDYLKLRGALVFRMNAGSIKRNVKLAPDGTPDILAILPWKTIWIEVKAGKSKLRKSQELMIKELEMRGQIVIIARSIDDVIGALDES